MDSTEFCVAYPEAPQTCKQLKCYNMLQGAKKVIFTACHSGKLKLTFTMDNVKVAKVMTKHQQAQHDLQTTR